MVASRWIPRGGANAATRFGRRFVRDKDYIGRITPQLAPHLLVQHLGHHITSAKRLANALRRIDGLFSLARSKRVATVASSCPAVTKSRRTNPALRVLLAQGVKCAKTVLAIITCKAANVVTHGICRPEPHHGAAPVSFFLDNLGNHFLRTGKEPARHFALFFIFQILGVNSLQLAKAEKRRPVNIACNVSQLPVIDDATVNYAV